jgi:alpha-tubulin suppressor-like RCC1 family protein
MQGGIMSLLRARRFSSSVLVVCLLLCAAIIVVFGAVTGTAVATTGGGGGDGKVQVQPQIACGGWYTVALKSDGSLWAWGDNTYGQLGLGDTTQRTSPTQVGSDNTWVAVTCGREHTVALKDDGSLWAWGSNRVGQLGLGDMTDRHSPTQVGTDSDWAAVAGGYWHTVALKSDGSLWAWGDNTYGELGLGDMSWRTNPTQVGSDTDWVAVAGGREHTLALKSDGTLWAWGRNDAGGQLGLGDTTDRLIPTQVGTENDWVTVACGAFHTVALKSDGSLWAWGDNTHGQLGQGGSDYTSHPSPARVGSDNAWEAVAGGGYHTVALKSDGSLWSWGWNDSGQLGQGDTIDRGSPTQVGADTDWVAVACGYEHTVALKSNGTLWAWGFNWEGQLGLGDTTDRHSASQVGTDNDWGAVALVVTSLTSSTHPNQALYYASNAPALAWTVGDPTAAVGYSYVLDQTPDTVPDTTIDTTATSISFTGLTNGVWYFHLRARCQAGAWSATATYTLRIDSTLPTTTDNSDGLWHRQFLLKLSASPAAYVVSTAYRIDGGPWQSGGSCLLRAVRRHHPGRRGDVANGSHTVQYFSTDTAGNSEAIKSCTVLLDNIPPRTYDDAPPMPQDGDVTVDLTATDSLSGVAHTYYWLDGGPWLEGTEVLVAAPTDESEAGEHTIWYYSTDAAGNVEPMRSCTVTFEAPWWLSSSAAEGTGPGQTATVHNRQSR